MLNHISHQQINPPTAVALLASNYFLIGGLTWYKIEMMVNLQRYVRYNLVHCNGINTLSDTGRESGITT